MAYKGGGVTMLNLSRSVMGELERMRRDMDRIWDRFSRGLSSPTLQQEWNPTSDLWEREDSLVAAIEVPGIDPKEIDITVTGDTLIIAGEKKQEGNEREKSHHLRERSFGKFSRSIRLPVTIDPDRVEARYMNGVLLITLGKIESIKSKRIAIKAE